MKSDPVDRRRFRRLQTTILVRPASLIARAKARRVKDISAGGLRAYSDEEHRAGEHVELELFFPDGATETFAAEVVWVTPLAPGAPARFDVGLRFVGTPSDEVQRIFELLGE